MAEQPRRPACADHPATAARRAQASEYVSRAMDRHLGARARTRLALLTLGVLLAASLPALGADRTGNERANNIKGTAEKDRLRGAGSRDKLFGRAGNDRLSGGTASDQLYGGD